MPYHGIEYKYFHIGGPMKKVLLIVLVLTMLFVVSGCATVLKGSKQSVSIDSNPAGAEVFVDGSRVGTTPVAVDLKKNKHSSIKVIKDGYEPQQQPLQKEYDMISILNAFWDWSTTDLITGNAFQYAPDAYYFNLQESK